MSSAQPERYRVDVSPINTLPYNSENGVVWIPDLSTTRIKSALALLTMLLESKQATKGYNLNRSVKLGIIRQLHADYSQGLLNLGELSATLRRFSIFLPTSTPEQPAITIPEDLQLGDEGVYLFVCDEESERMRERLREVGVRALSGGEGNYIMTTSAVDMAELVEEFETGLEVGERIGVGEMRVETEEEQQQQQRPAMGRSFTVPGTFTYGGADLEAMRMRRQAFWGRFPSVDHDNYIPGGGWMD